jgi:type II secretory pathway component PulF
MPEAEIFDYQALDSGGRRIRGSVTAIGQDQAFDQIKAKGLSPLTIRSVASRRTTKTNARLSDREISAFAADLAALLRADADMRSALAILAPQSDQRPLAVMIRQMSAEISGGGALDRAFAQHLPARHVFISALVSAGEASGDIAGGLERGAEMLESQLQAKDQLVSILAYPVFVLISAIIALLAILLLVVPSLSPLAKTPGAHPGAAMLILLAASDFLRGNLLTIGVGLACLLAIGIGGYLAGLWAPILDRVILYGPFKRLSGALIYGGFAVALGGILAAGAPMGDALRLAIRATRSNAARQALEPLMKAVREGQSLSAALGQVKGFPGAIERLAVIGEQSGALGPMLLRAGRMEERTALRAIEAAGRIIGPAIIVVLGGMIGLLMGGLLSGVSGLGDAALQ